jgi:hypothetical protein
VLSVLLQEMPEAMKTIADHHFTLTHARPGQTRILDVSYGNGALTSRLQGVVGLDINPGSLAKIHADSSERIPLEDASVDYAVFDPPYLYGRTSRKIHERPNSKWQHQHSRNDSPAAFSARASGTARELYRVIGERGKAVVKVADARLDGRLIRNGRLIEEAFEGVGFVLIDHLVYVRLGTGIFKSKTTQAAHGYFLVFERPVAQLGEIAA